MARGSHSRGRQGGVGMTRNGIHLTDRELDVLRRSARGQSTSEIAGALDVGYDRIKTLKQSIKKKIGLDKESDTDAMVAQGRRQGFIN